MPDGMWSTEDAAGRRFAAGQVRAHLWPGPLVWASTAGLSLQPREPRNRGVGRAPARGACAPRRGATDEARPAGAPAVPRQEPDDHDQVRSARAASPRVPVPDADRTQDGARRDALYRARREAPDRQGRARELRPLGVDRPRDEDPL